MIAIALTAAILGAIVGRLLAQLALRISRGAPVSSGSGTRTQPARAWDVVPAVQGDPAGEGGSGDTGITCPTPVPELITGTLFALMVVRFGISWALPPYLTLAVAAVLLGLVDLQSRRLPNNIVGLFAGAALTTLGLACLVDGSWGALLRGVLGAALSLAFYVTLALISPSSLGMGDVKLGGVLGLYLAFTGWRALILGTAGAFVLAALAGVLLMATGLANRRTQIPFGPAMLIAAVAVITFSAGSATP